MSADLDAPVASIDLYWSWLKKGWKYRLARNPRMQDLEHQQEYIDRVKSESEVIVGKGFVDYMLLLSDFTRFAKDSGIPVGPGRGSAAASVVSYLLRITEIDPLAFPGLLFERFLSPERTDPPDIDLDFDDERRDEVRLHLIDKFGADRVGNIGTFTQYRAKNSLDDVRRVHKGTALEIPFFDVETVKGLVIERASGDLRFDDSLADTFESFPVAKKILAKYPALGLATRLEGNYRGMGVHAAGLVVAASPITDTCAVYTKKTSNGREMAVLSVDKYDAEYVNMLKIDALGLSTMGMIRLAIEKIGITLEDLYAIDVNEPAVIAAFHSGDVVGIFQFEGRTTRLVTIDVRPDTFQEICDINSLSRPGPLLSGAAADYISVKHGRKNPVELHPIADAITEWTHNCIVYQEQILQLCGDVGGLSWTDRNAIRSIISRSKGEQAMNKLYQQFVDGAAKKGISEEVADRVWRRIVTAGSYAFNTAHAVSYAMIATWSMWLKVNHPVEFYWAQLMKSPEDKWSRLIKDAEKHGIKVVGPSLLKSDLTWSIQGGKENQAVIAGWTQIKGIGDRKALEIVKDKKENGAFAEWSDLSRVKGIGPKTVTVIQESAETDDPFGLLATGRLLRNIRRQIMSGELGEVPIPTHTSDEVPQHGTNIPVVFIGRPLAINYQDYIEKERSRSGEDVATIIARMSSPDLVTSVGIRAFDDGDEDVYLRFNRFVFPSIKAKVERCVIGRHVIVVKGMKKEGFGVAIHSSRMWLIDPDAEDWLD